MDKVLMDCCEKMIDILNALKDNGCMTQEEYNEHIALKLLFLTECAPSKNCLSSKK